MLKTETIIKLMEIIESNLECCDKATTFKEMVMSGSKESEPEMQMWQELDEYMLDERGYDRWEAIGGDK